MNKGNEIALPRNPIDGINYVKLVISSARKNLFQPLPIEYLQIGKRWNLKQIWFLQIAL